MHKVKMISRVNCIIVGIQSTLALYLYKVKRSESVTSRFSS
jgi:hypothetical protein